MTHYYNYYIQKKMELDEPTRASLFHFAFPLSLLF
jgi:hypothetical protein